MHISFIIVEISKIFGEIGNLVSFIIVGKHLTHMGPVRDGQKPERPVFTPESPETGADTEARILLFKTPTCPNCKAAGAILDKAGVSYTLLNAEEEPALVRKYDIMQAPTMILVKGNGFEKYRGVSEIKGWAAGR